MTSKKGAGVLRSHSSRCDEWGRIIWHGLFGEGVEGEEVGLDLGGEGGLFFGVVA